MQTKMPATIKTTRRKLNSDEIDMWNLLPRKLFGKLKD